MKSGFTLISALLCVLLLFLYFTHSVGAADDAVLNEVPVQAVEQGYNNRTFHGTFYRKFFGKIIICFYRNIIVIKLPFLFNSRNPNPKTRDRSCET